MIQEARSAVDCFATALLNALICCHEESRWFNDCLLKLDALISRTVTCQFLTEYAEQYQAQIQQWKNQALTDLEHLQTQWNENSRLQKKNERFTKMKTIKIINKARMLRVCNDLSWLFIDNKKLDMHFTNDNVQTACMNWIIDWMLSTFSLVNVYQELVQNCFKF